MAEKKKQETEENKARHSAPPVWEWVIAAVGLILVVGAIGTTAYRAVTEDDTPPILEVSVDSVQPVGDGFLVRFTVKNKGSQSAAALNVEGELKRGEESIETSAATLTYAPANSRREGGLFFSKNPHEYDLKIRVTGFQKP